MQSKLASARFHHVFLETSKGRLKNNFGNWLYSQVAAYGSFLMDGYRKLIEVQMVNFYRSLSEKDRRRYAAVEAGKLGQITVSPISNR
jgi:hypothetical protein